MRISPVHETGCRFRMTDPWESVSETLVFQVGPFVLGRWTFDSLSNRASPLVLGDSAPILPPIIRPTTYQQLPDDGTISCRVSFDRNAIRYVSYRGKRYFVDLRSMTFSEYLGKFSKKTRYNLRRTIRNFAEQSDGIIDLRCYQLPQEMAEFCAHALAISRLSYQSKIGFGFPETEEFKTKLIGDAENGEVCGFVLMQRDRPVSYAFCRIASDIVTYSIPGYDPEFTRLSPGTVLLYTILEKLFAERRFRLFDFGGQEWDYKTMFATGQTNYLKVIWFPKTISNFVLIMLHLVVLQAWSGAALVKETCRSSVRVVNSGITRFRRLTHFRDKARGASAIANRAGAKVHNYRQARHG